ncbi:MAG TPA: hypothetical protein VM146_13315 [Steroidobacteraceae bacterium]|nr:hypothetical protein [Steroidobacteraceae bacterium]
MNTKRCWAAFATAALLSAGCANSLQFNFRPAPVMLASAAESPGTALVLGQAYSRGPADWVQIFVTSVDDAKTWSATQLRPDLNLVVPAGKRTFKVRVQIGDYVSSQESPVDPEVTAELLPGMAYQLNVREGTDVRGRAGIDVSVERIGTVAKYEKYAAEHPGAAGRPVGTL